MNNQELQTLTAQTIQKLIQGATKETKLWISQGETIKDFIVAIQEDHSKDAYKILASYPDCPYHDKQLRFYVRCYDLYNALNVKENNLAMTHFIVVLDCSLTMEEKKQLLQAASKHNLSISQFKEVVQSFRVENKGGMKTSRVPCSMLPILFQKAHQRYIKALANLNGKEQEAVVKSIHEILQLAITSGYDKNALAGI